MQSALLVLGVALWLWGAALAVAGQPAGSQVCKSECAKFHSKIPWQMLQSYERTKCGKAAVFLTTKKNRTYCADPAAQWVQDAMLKLDEKKVDTSVPKESGEFQKHLGLDVLLTTEAGLFPTERFSTAAYGMTTTFVQRTEVPEPSAVNSMSVGPQITKFSTGSTFKPKLFVSGITEPHAHGSMVSRFTDGPKSSGEGLAPVGKGLEDISGITHDLVVPPTPRAAVDDEYHKSRTIINLLKKDSTLNGRLQLPSDGQGSAIKQVTEKPTVGLSAVPPKRDFTSPTGAHANVGGSRKESVKNRSAAAGARTKTSEAPLSTQANRDVFSTFSGTVSQSSTLHEEHLLEKNRGEALAPSAEAPLIFLPGALAGYRSHIISMVSLGVILCISLVVAGFYAKSCICSRASPTEMVQELTFLKHDLQTGACAMQVL